MRVKLAIVAAAATTLSACGSFEEGKEAGFRESFAESCQGSATQAGTPTDIAKKVCDCAVEKVITEVGIDLAPLPSKSQEIMQACIEETGVAVPG